MDDDLDCSFGDDEFGIANSTFNSVALGESCESSFEADNPDEEGLLPGSRAKPITSTPSKPKGGRFKVPKPPPAKYFQKCSMCGKYIVTERGFRTHMQTHRWKGKKIC